MALASTQTLPNVASVNHDFVTVNVLGTTVTRIDQTTTLANPTTMLIRHLTRKAGTVVIDKHTVSFRKTGTDAVTGAKTDGIITLSIELPQSGAVVAADVQDLLAYMRAFLPSAAPAANFASLLLGMS
jgi:hypothetical protein